MQNKADGLERGHPRPIGTEIGQNGIGIEGNGDDATAVVNDGDGNGRIRIPLLGIHHHGAVHHVHGSPLVRVHPRRFLLVEGGFQQFFGNAALFPDILHLVVGGIDHLHPTAALERLRGNDAEIFIRLVKSDHMGTALIN